MDISFFVENVRAFSRQKGEVPFVSCKKAGVGSSFVSDVENGLIPSIEKMEKLSSYFDVSVKELTGEDVTKFSSQAELNAGGKKDEHEWDAADRIFNLVDLKYQEQRMFAQDLNMTPSIVSEWRRRRSSSYMKRLPQIAAILDTSVEYLLTGEKEKPATVSGDGQVQEFVGLFDKLTAEQQALVIAQIKGILSNQ